MEAGELVHVREGGLRVVDLDGGVGPAEGGEGGEVVQVRVEAVRYCERGFWVAHREVVDEVVRGNDGY